MVAWNRNEPLVEKRRAQLFVYDVDGQPAAATTLFNGTGELLVDKGDGHYLAPSGTLVNTDRPLAIADDVIEGVNTGTNILTLTAHGYKSGDGPVQATNSGGALPAGMAPVTNYWISVVSANGIQLFPSLADLLAGTNVIDLTTAGTGVNTIVAVAGTKRLNDGAWNYVASQGELAYRGSYFAIRISKPNFRDTILVVPLRDEQQLHAGTAQGGGASTITLDAGASATNDLYRDAIALIVGGTGAGQSNSIASYVGGTKVATMARAWAIVPDATSQFVVVPSSTGANPASVAAAVWATALEGAHTAGDLMRGMISILAGPKSGYDAGTIEAKSLNGATTRWQWTTDQTGVLTVIPVILT